MLKSSGDFTGILQISAHNFFSFFFLRDGLEREIRNDQASLAASRLAFLKVCPAAHQNNHQTFINSSFSCPEPGVTAIFAATATSAQPAAPMPGQPPVAAALAPPGATQRSPGARDQWFSRARRYGVVRPPFGRRPSPHRQNRRVLTLRSSIEPLSQPGHDFRYDNIAIICQIDALSKKNRSFAFSVDFPCRNSEVFF